jgi:geranylgeranyl diphosphate synthase type II
VGIWDQLEPKRQSIEAALADLFAVRRDTPAAVWEAMRYAVLGGGKRLRPVLCLLACEAVGEDPGWAMDAAGAVELVHTYSLVHDDLPAMDDDDLRRGRPTCHKVYGEALAILAGDGLLTLAFECLAFGRPAQVAASVRELARGAGAAGMVGGQTLDLIAEGKVAGPTPATVADLEAIHRAKTGALIRSAVRLGVLAAGRDRVPDPADRYADALGLLFQVTDDLLDVASTEAATGKRVNKDAGRGKLTFPGLLGVEASRRRAADLCDQAVTAAGAFGPAGRPLADLARWVVDRDR